MQQEGEAISGEAFASEEKQLKAQQVGDEPDSTKPLDGPDGKESINGPIA